MKPGDVVDLGSGVRRIVAPNPGIMTGPGTNTYLLGSDSVALIDPGPDDDAHFAALCEAVGDRLRWVLATHTHIDDSPLAARLKTATGAQVLGFGKAPTVKVPGLDSQDLTFSPDRRLADGDVLETPELTLAAVHTPGHASNHLCFQLRDTGLLFSGDHVMSGSTVVIAPPDGDMALYLEAIERVRDLAPARIAPGHGEMIEDAGAVLNEYLAHRRSRETQVLAGLAGAGQAGVTSSALVESIYVDVPDKLHPVARYSVWAHLRKLAAESRAATTALDDPDATWWAAGFGPRASSGI